MSYSNRLKDLIKRPVFLAAATISINEGKRSSNTKPNCGDKLFLSNNFPNDLKVSVNQISVHETFLARQIYFINIVKFL